MHEISTLTRVGRLAIVLADNHVRPRLTRGWQNRRRSMIEAVFRYRALSRPTQHLCMPAGNGR